jgi:hypothetical protein
MPDGFYGNIHSWKWVLCKWESLLYTVCIHFQHKYLCMQSYSCYSRVIIWGTKLMNCLLYSVTSRLWKSLCIVKRVNLRMPQWTGQVDQMNTNIAELQWGNSTAWKSRLWEDNIKAYLWGRCLNAEDRWSWVVFGKLWGKGVKIRTGWKWVGFNELTIKSIKSPVML